MRIRVADKVSYELIQILAGYVSSSGAEVMLPIDVRKAQSRGLRR